MSYISAFIFIVSMIPFGHDTFPPLFRTHTHKNLLLDTPLKQPSQRRQPEWSETPHLTHLIGMLPIMQATSGCYQPCTRIHMEKNRQNGQLYMIASFLIAN